MKYAFYQFKAPFIKVQTMLKLILKVVEWSPPRQNEITELEFSALLGDQGRGLAEAL